MREIPHRVPHHSDSPLSFLPNISGSCVPVAMALNGPSAIRLFVLDYFRSRTISTMLIGERQSSPSLSLALID
jgi:hypothetical protein